MAICDRVPGLDVNIYLTSDLCLTERHYWNEGLRYLDSKHKKVYTQIPPGCEFWIQCFYFEDFP